VEIVNTQPSGNGPAQMFTGDAWFDFGQQPAQTSPSSLPIMSERSGQAIWDRCLRRAHVCDWASLRGLS
jgi:hypothetical protein